MVLIPWQEGVTFPVLKAAIEATECLVEFPAAELPNAPKLSHLGYMFITPGDPMILGAWYCDQCNDCTIVQLRGVK